MHKRGRESWYRVHDRAGFQKALAAVERMAGSQQAAAKRLDLSQGHFSKLRRGRPDQGGQTFGVSRRVVGRLQALFGDDVWNIFVSPPARGLLARHDAWMRSHRFPPHDRGSPYYQVAQMLPPEAGELVQEFLDDMFYKGHEWSRVSFAYHRVLDRLLDFTRSPGIERTPKEMSGRELARFVKAALTCERILLNRPPDVQRAQAIAPGLEALATKRPARRRRRLSAPKRSRGH